MAVPVNRAAVIGAGIMGGGVAYQSAFKGIPIELGIHPSWLLESL